MGDFTQLRGIVFALAYGMVRYDEVPTLVERGELRGLTPLGEAVWAAYPHPFLIARAAEDLKLLDLVESRVIRVRDPLELLSRTYSRHWYCRPPDSMRAVTTDKREAHRVAEVVAEIRRRVATPLHPVRYPDQAEAAVH